MELVCLGPAMLRIKKLPLLAATKGKYRRCCDKTDLRSNASLSSDGCLRFWKFRITSGDLVMRHSRHCGKEREADGDGDGNGKEMSLLNAIRKENRVWIRFEDFEAVESVHVGRRKLCHLKGRYKVRLQSMFSLKKRL
jgi:hypothetical protein